VQNFIDAVRAHVDPIAPVEYGASTDTLCCLFNIARELNRPVMWNPALLSFEDDKEAAAHRLYWYEYRRPYKLPVLRQAQQYLIQRQNNHRKSTCPTQACTLFIYT